MICQATINDDFDEESVVVILDKKISGINKNPDKNLFAGVEIKSIEDLTCVSKESIKYVNKDSFRQIFLITLATPGKENVLNAVKKLEKVKGIKKAGPNMYLTSDSAPSDPYYNASGNNPGQWGMKKIQAEEAWDITTGNNIVRIGIIDSGVGDDYINGQISHPDLNINTTLGGNFFTATVNSNDSITPGQLLPDTHGHGTQVAGVAGAIAGNSRGVVGTAWGAEIVPMRMRRNNGLEDMASCVRAVNYATSLWDTENRISILNLSYGTNVGASDWEEMRMAISTFPGLVVCSAGNINLNTDTTFRYPGYYASSLYSNPLTNLICVGASNSNDGVSTVANSNWGANTVTLFAPGENIITTHPMKKTDCDLETGLKIVSGTSLSAPMVAGVAALCLSINPDMTTEQLKTAITNGVDIVPGLNEKCVTGGRLNAYKAVSSAYSSAKFNYTVSNGKATITGKKSGYTLPTTFRMPSVVTSSGVNYPVTEIGNSAFTEDPTQPHLQRIYMPHTVTRIQDNAFTNCKNLLTVYMASSTIPISESEFFVLKSNNNHSYTSCLDCHLLPDKAYTFSFRSSASSSTGNTCDGHLSLGVGENALQTVVAEYSFSGGGLHDTMFIPTQTQLSSSSKLWMHFYIGGENPPSDLRVTIADMNLEMGVIDIAINAFRGCDNLSSSLQELNFSSDNSYNPSYYTVSQISNTATGHAIFIPSTYQGKPVKRIAASGFSGNKNIKWVFMQQNLDMIGNRAFQYCSNLLKVDMIQTAVTSIEAYTFDVCAQDSDPNHVHNPHSFLQGHCWIDEITYPPLLTTIGEGAFIRTGIPDSCPLPNSVTKIGAYACRDSSRISLQLPNSLNEIGQEAFKNCSTLLVYNLDIGLSKIGKEAFCNTVLFNVDHLPMTLTQIGEKAFYATDIKNIVLTNSVTYVGKNAFDNCPDLTIYTTYDYATSGPVPSGWNSNWNSSGRPVVWNCTLSGDNSYIYSFEKKASNVQNYSNGIGDPYREGYKFNGWNTAQNGSGTWYYGAGIASVSNGTILYSQWKKKSCVAEGTLITLADGTQVAVEDLTGEEDLLVWNMLTGEYDSAPILFIDSDPSMAYQIIELTFSDGTEVKVIDEHAFFDMTLGEYIFLRSDAAQYIGHYFNKQGTNGAWTTVQLTDVDVYTEVTTAWSPVTYGHLCYYVNGMLSMPGATEGLVNIFEVDTTLMQYDEEAMEEDILTYGLFTYEEFNAIIPLPELVFDAFCGQYLKVSIGKGFITLSEIAALLDRYSGFFE